MNNDISWIYLLSIARAQNQTNQILKQQMEEAKIKKFDLDLYYSLKAQNKEVAEEYLKYWEQVAEEEKRKAEEAEKQAAEQKLNELSQSIETIAKNEKLRDVLEAPVATNKELSPEQLKEKLHQNLNETAKKADKSINIEIKVLDGKQNS